MPPTLSEVKRRLLSFLEFKGEAGRRTALSVWDIGFAAILILVILGLASALVYVGVIRPK
jgi:hypothetical protein